MSPAGTIMLSSDRRLGAWFLPTRDSSDESRFTKDRPITHILGTHIENSDKPGVDYAGFFGAALRVSGRDRDALAKAVAPYHGREDIDVHEEAPSLEDVFIQLQEKAG